MIIRQISVLLFLSLLLAITGCSSTNTKSDDEMMTDSVEDGAPIDVGADDQTSSGLDEDEW